MSQLAKFIEKLNSDENLRKEVEEAEKQAAARTAKLQDDIDAVNRDNLDALRAIALAHGFDIELGKQTLGDPAAPSEQEIENARCLLTCCWVVTSVWDGEGIPTVDGPGCGFGTTSDCPL